MRGGLNLSSRVPPPCIARYEGPHAVCSPARQGRRPPLPITSLHYFCHTGESRYPGGAVGFPFGFRPSPE